MLSLISQIPSVQSLVSKVYTFVQQSVLQSSYHVPYDNHAMCKDCMQLLLQFKIHNQNSCCTGWQASHLLTCDVYGVHLVRTARKFRVARLSPQVRNNSSQPRASVTEHVAGSAAKSFRSASDGQKPLCPAHRRVIAHREPRWAGDILIEYGLTAATFVMDRWSMTRCSPSQKGLS